MNSGTAEVLANLIQNYSTSSIPPKKSIFGIHDHCGIKLLFQLRVGLSPLKGHKKNHNFWTLHRQYVTVEVVRKIPFISLLNVPYLQLSGLI